MIDALIVGVTLAVVALALGIVLTGLVWLVCALFDIGEPW